MFRTLTPAIRIDAMGYDAWNSGFEVARLTAGLKFGLTFLPNDSLLRIDYKQYFSEDNLVTQVKMQNTNPPTLS